MKLQPICECGESHPEGHRFFVSVMNDVGKKGLLLGPYDTHAEALANVDRGRQLVMARYYEAPWYSFGTCGMPTDLVASAMQHVIFAAHTHEQQGPPPPPEKRVHRKGRKTITAYRHD